MMTYRVPVEFEIDLSSGLVTVAGGNPLFQIDPVGTYQEIQARLVEAVSILMDDREHLQKAGGVAELADAPDSKSGEVHPS